VLFVVGALLVLRVGAATAREAEDTKRAAG
jgi:hypothetical protein